MFSRKKSRRSRFFQSLTLASSRAMGGNGMYIEIVSRELAEGYDVGPVSERLGMIQGRYDRRHTTG